MVAIGGGFVVLSKLDTGFSEFITGSVVKVRRPAADSLFCLQVYVIVKFMAPCRARTTSKKRVLCCAREAASPSHACYKGVAKN